MDIQLEKIELVKMLLSTNNLKIIKSVKQIFEQEKNHDFWDELSADEQREIEEADLEVEQGKVADFEIHSKISVMNRKVVLSKVAEKKLQKLSDYLIKT